MKKIISVLLITILAFSIMVSTSSVFAVANIGIQTNSDHTNGKLNQSGDLVISVGSKVQLYAFLMEGVEVTGDALNNVTWSTSNVQSVAVSEFGLITGLKNGSSTITATYDGGFDTIKVTVGSGTASDDVPTSGESSTSGGTSTGGSGNQSETPSTGTVEENGISWPNLSSAKFSMTKEQAIFLDCKLKVTNISTSVVKSFLEAYTTNGVYVYLSTDSSSLKLDDPTKSVFDDSKYKKAGTQTGSCDENITFPVICYSSLRDNNTLDININADEIYARKNEFYGSIYGTAYKDGKYITKELVPPTKITKPSKETWGNKMKFDFWDDSTYVAINEPTSYAQKTGHLIIGQITDDKILDNFRNDTSDKFEKLVEYASAKNNKVTEISLDFSERNGSGGTNQIIETMTTKGLDLKHNAYYYIYSTLDGNNGKYNEVTDVDICRAIVVDGKKSLQSTKDFGSGSNTDDGNGVSLNGGLEKDPTTSNGKLPQTGMSNAVTAGIAATVLLTIVSYVVYSKNKDIR